MGSVFFDSAIADDERRTDCTPVTFFLSATGTRALVDLARQNAGRSLHPHRDTWYSAPMCQLNWWIPIHPLDPDNTKGFYPRYFKEPVRNNSGIYNYYEWNAKSRATAAQQVKSDTREQPKAQQELETVT